MKVLIIDGILVVAAIAVGVWAFELKGAMEIACFAMPVGAWLWLGHKIMDEP